MTSRARVCLHLFPTCVLLSPLPPCLNRDLVKVSEWCDLWGMKLNASKTKTMIVSRSRKLHSQSLLLTIGGTVWKESDDLDILRVTIDTKMTFEMHLRSVSRAASQMLGIMIDFFLGDAFRVLFCHFLNTVLRCGARLP